MKDRKVNTVKTQWILTSVCKMKDSKVNTVNYNKCVQNERQQGKHSEL